MIHRIFTSILYLDRPPDTPRNLPWALRPQKPPFYHYPSPPLKVPLEAWKSSLSWCLAVKINMSSLSLLLVLSFLNQGYICEAPSIFLQIIHILKVQNAFQQSFYTWFILIIQVSHFKKCHFLKGNFLCSFSFYLTTLLYQVCISGILTFYKQFVGGKIDIKYAS